MTFLFFFGPDKVLVDPENLWKNPVIPFHGIVSLGLLENLLEKDPEGISWYRYAYILDKELQSRTKLEDPMLTQLLEYAKSNCVLTFMQSAQCAKKYVERFIESDPSVVCELWNIKEGHTASVWKCSLFDREMQTRGIFILNVARDKCAGKELKRISIKMQEIVRHCPRINMAKVLDIQFVDLTYFGRKIRVVVTKNEYMDKCYEISTHYDKKNNREQLLLVERFLTNGINPVRITSIFGRRFSDNESDRIKSDISSFINNVPSRFKPKISIQKGDVVWDGKKAIVVSIS